jgi:integrase/recombinase XerC
VNVFIDSFIYYLKHERNYSQSTISAYANDLQQFEVYVVEKVGVFDPIQVDLDIVRGWIVLLLEYKKSPVSVNRKLSSLKSFFKYLLKRGDITDNPLRLAVGPKASKPLPYFVKEKDLVQVLDGDGFERDFEGVRNRLVVEMLYDTGIRRSELIGLKRSDVDYGLSQIKVIGKRNKQRLIPFADGLKNMMLAYEEVRDCEIEMKEDWFFVRKNGVQLSASIVYTVVKKALSAIPTLAKRSPHILRHSFATSMLNNGAELNAIKELLGHSSLLSTSIYTHTTFEKIKKMYHAHPRANEKGGIMEIRIQAIHFDASEQLESFVQKKVSKLEQYFDGVMSVEVSLKVIKPEVARNKQVGIKLIIKSGELFAEKTADSFEGAVDDATEALEKQLVKFKEKARVK